MGTASLAWCSRSRAMKSEHRGRCKQVKSRGPARITQASKPRPAGQCNTMVLVLLGPRGRCSIAKPRLFVAGDFAASERRSKRTPAAAWFPAKARRVVSARSLAGCLGFFWRWVVPSAALRRRLRCGWTGRGLARGCHSRVARVEGEFLANACRREPRRRRSAIRDDQGSCARRLRRRSARSACAVRRSGGIGARRTAKTQFNSSAQVTRCALDSLGGVEPPADAQVDGRLLAAA